MSSLARDFPPRETMLGAWLGSRRSHDVRRQGAPAKTLVAHGVAWPWLAVVVFLK